MHGNDWTFNSFWAQKSGNQRIKALVILLLNSDKISRQQSQEIISLMIFPAKKSKVSLKSISKPVKVFLN